MGRKQKPISTTTLVESAGNRRTQRDAAQALGVSESTLRRRMRAEGTTWQDKQRQYNPLAPGKPTDPK